MAYGRCRYRPGRGWDLAEFLRNYEPFWAAQVRRGSRHVRQPDDRLVAWPARPGATGAPGAIGQRWDLIAATRTSTSPFLLFRSKLLLVIYCGYLAIAISGAFCKAWL